LAIPLVATGKGFGLTHIIALAAEHTVIQDQRVLVRRDDAKVPQPAARRLAADLQLHPPMQSLNRHRR
jgi:hypothetical protein